MNYALFDKDEEALAYLAQYIDTFLFGQRLTSPNCLSQVAVAQLHDNIVIVCTLPDII